LIGYQFTAADWKSPTILKKHGIQRRFLDNK
jgi:hypothetical protein